MQSWERSSKKILPRERLIANKKTADGQPYTFAVIPSFIPTAFGMDGFTYDATAKTAIMKFDMNRVLVANKTATQIFPFQ